MWPVKYPSAWRYDGSSRSPGGSGVCRSSVRVACEYRPESMLMREGLHWGEVPKA